MATAAIGLYMIKMDNAGRIHVNGPMWEYFEPEKINNSLVQINIHKDNVEKKEKDESAIYCCIGFPTNPEISSLILISDSVASAKLEETRKKDMEELFEIPANQSEDSNMQIYDLYRKTEIRSRKIQFSVKERKYLRIPANDNRIIVEGRSIKYVVWAASEYARRFPDRYARFGFDEESPKRKKKD